MKLRIRGPDTKKDLQNNAGQALIAKAMSVLQEL